MPSFFEGMGQGAMGGLALQKAQAGVAQDQEDVKSSQIGNKAALEGLQRAIEGANDDKQMRSTWAKALGQAMALRDAQAAPDADDAALDAFYGAKDDPTQASIKQLRGMMQRVAETDPKAALALGEEIGGAIAQRKQEGNLRAVQESASKAIGALQEMSAEGFLPEAASQQMAAQVQEILEALDENPEMLAQSAASIQKIRATATQAYMQGAEKASAVSEMQGLVDRLPPSMKKFGALAMAQVANGGDPVKVLAGLADRVYGAADPDPEAEFKRPGPFEQSPRWVQERIRQEGTSDALEFLGDRKVPINPESPLAGERGMTPDEILAELPKWEDRFLRRAMARNNKFSEPQMAGPQPWTPPAGRGTAGAVGAPDQQAEMRKVLTAPAPRGMGLRAGPDGIPKDSGVKTSMRQGSGTTDRVTDAGDAVVRGRERKPVSIKGLRKRGKQTPLEYLDYVKKAITARGGTAEDVARALEAAGLTPADFAEKEKKKGAVQVKERGEQ